MTASYTNDGFENGCGTAINGNTNTQYVNGNCVHSSTTRLNPMWTVDLDEEYLITSIIFFARAYGESKDVQRSQVRRKCFSFSSLTQMTSLLSFPIFTNNKARLT